MRLRALFNSLRLRRTLLFSIVGRLSVLIFASGRDMSMSTVLPVGLCRVVCALEKVNVLHMLSFFLLIPTKEGLRFLSIIVWVAGVPIVGLYRNDF